MNDPRERDLVGAARREAEAIAAAASPARLPSLPPRDAFPGYTIVRELHRGGQGVVYEAIQSGTERRVAVKVMREGPFAGDVERARFDREARILGRLRHPDIVAIHEFGEAAGHVYYVMDLIDGEPFDVAARGRTPRETMTVFHRVCRAVAAAHVNGIIHRDLKPQNILVDEDGAPHVLDFGLAKLTDSDERGPVAGGAETVVGSFLGSLPWASPEQADGTAGEADVRTDVYALGVVLHQALSGTFPYPISGSVTEAIDAIRTTPPARLRTVVPVDRDVETITLKALEKEPARRYQSAAELALDVERYLDGAPIAARLGSPWYVLGKQLRRHRRKVLVAAAFLAVLVIGAGLWLDSRARAADADRAFAALAPWALKGLEDPFRRERPPETLLDAYAAALRRVGDGDDPGDAAVRHRLLGLGFLAYERTADGLEHLTRAAALFAEVVPADELECATGALHLGRALFADGRPAEAAAQYRRAVEIRGARLGADSPAYASALHELAACLRRLGELAEAEILGRTALDIRSRVLPAGDPYVAASMNNLGLTLLEQGRFEEAEAMLAAAIHLVEAKPDFEPRFLVRTRVNIARCRIGRGDLLSAQTMMTGALATPGIGARDRSACMIELGRAAAARGAANEARSWFDAALVERTDALGPDHPETAEVYVLRGMASTALGALDGAETDLVRGLALLVERFGPDHPDAARARSGLARLRAEQGRMDEAREAATAALAAQRMRLPSDHPDVRASETLLDMLDAPQP